jgi:hypothetical protein
MLHFIFFLAFLMPLGAFAIETAKVLPKGVFRARVLGVQTEAVSDKYNSNGLLEGMTAPLNRTVTVGDLAAADPDVAKLVTTLNNLKPGLGSQLMNAQMYSTFESFQRQWIPALEYGISERTTIGIKVPIVRRVVSTSFWVDSNNGAFSTAQKLGSINPEVQEGLKKFGNYNFGTDFFVNQLFISKGYEAPSGFDRTEFGDVEIGAKFNYYKTDQWLAALAGGLRFPTGSTAALNNPYDKGSGTGAWGVGAQFVEAYQPHKRVDFRAMQKFTYSFPDTRNRAVPRDANDTLPSLLPEDGQVQPTRREQTATIETELGSNLYFLDDAVVAWGAYQYGYKGHDRYTGPGDLYYAGLGKDTDWEKHSAEIGTGYSTIPAFRRGQFALPLEVQLLWNTTLSGRNIPLANYMRMDFMAYF